MREDDDDDLIRILQKTLFIKHLIGIYSKFVTSTIFLFLSKNKIHQILCDLNREKENNALLIVIRF